MNPIRQYHIEHPTEERTLCYLKVDSLWADGGEDNYLVSVEESVEEDDYIVESYKCDICWRDDEERILMILAHT
jgi:hypothetical protein